MVSRRRRVASIALLVVLAAGLGGVITARDLRRPPVPAEVATVPWDQAGMVSYPLTGDYGKVTLGAVAWRRPGLTVLGGPIGVAGRVIVVTVSPSHQLELMALSATTGETVWEHPFGAGFTAPGTQIDPISIKGVVLDLSPVGGEASGIVQPEGVSASTGQVGWTGAPIAVTDAPVICPGNIHFCVTGYGTQGASLYQFDPLYAAMGSDPRIARSLGGNLFEETTNPPAITTFSRADLPTWSGTFAKFFGNRQYNPDNGWFFADIDNMVVGTLSIRSRRLSARTFGMTVGITGKGETAWRTRGLFDCGGALPVVADYVCRISGSTRLPARGMVGDRLRGVSMSLAGLDPSSGHTTWQQSLGHWAALLVGAVRLVGPTQIVLPGRGLKRTVLDLATGATSSVGAQAPAWCVRRYTFAKVTPVRHDPYFSRRIAVSTASGCHADGSPATTLPAHPFFGGALVDGTFVWPTPNGGLEAAVTVG